MNLKRIASFGPALLLLTGNLTPGAPIRLNVDAADATRRICERVVR